MKRNKNFGEHLQRVDQYYYSLLSLYLHLLIGIIFSDGHNWVEQRKFAAKALKTLSDSKFLEKVITEEAEIFQKCLQETCGQEIVDIRCQ